MQTDRQHAGPTGPTLPAAPETSLAERARTLVHVSSLGSLSTHSRRQPGFPFGSVMPYAPDDLGRPVIFISSMAMHTQNLHADARAGMLVSQETGGDPLGAARVTLLGEVRPVPPAETASMRELYFARHENARYWSEFTDFAIHRMEPSAVYYIGGFGVMGWITADEYIQSRPDPLAGSATGILQHMNTDHAPALVLLARAAGQPAVDTATMTAIDRLGFQLRLQSGERVHGLRIAFPQAVHDSQEVRTVLVQMVRAARANG